LFAIARSDYSRWVRIEAYVSVSPEVLQELDLAQSALGENLLAKDIGDLLDGDPLVGLIVHGSAVAAMLARGLLW
jgi:hypothetical protein